MGIARGSLDGIATGFSARGPQQPNYAFGSPRIAVQELFKSVSKDKDARTQYLLERKILEFVAKNEGRTAGGLDGYEKGKIQGYADSVEAGSRPSVTPSSGRSRMGGRSSTPRGRSAQRAGFGSVIGWFPRGSWGACEGHGRSWWARWDSNPHALAGGGF